MMLPFRDGDWAPCQPAQRRRNSDRKFVWTISTSLWIPFAWASKQIVLMLCAWNSLTLVNIQESRMYITETQLSLNVFAPAQPALHSSSLYAPPHMLPTSWGVQDGDCHQLPTPRIEAGLSCTSLIPKHIYAHGSMSGKSEHSESTSRTMKVSWSSFKNASVLLFDTLFTVLFLAQYF